MINNRVRYLNESPATIGDNGEKIFSQGNPYGSPCGSIFTQLFQTAGISSPQ